MEIMALAKLCWDEGIQSRVGRARKEDKGKGREEREGVMLKYKG